MTASTFDPLEVARELRAAGIDGDHAEAIAGAMRKAAVADHADLATKAELEMRAVTRADLAPLATKAELEALRSEIRADLYRALWIQGGAVIAILTALRFLPV